MKSENQLDLRGGFYIKKFICLLVSTVVLVASSFSVSANSDSIEYNNDSLSEEIMVYDCKAGRYFTKVVNYESIIPSAELRSTESENVLTLYSPGYVAEENDMTYEENSQKETRSTS